MLGGIRAREKFMIRSAGTPSNRTAPRVPAYPMGKACHGLVAQVIAAHTGGQRTRRDRVPRWLRQRHEPGDHA